MIYYLLLQYISFSLQTILLDRLMYEYILISAYLISLENKLCFLVYMSDSLIEYVQYTHLSAFIEMF